MGRFELKNVQRKGAYFYFRRKVGGKDHYIRIPAPDHPDFAQHYAELSVDEEDATGKRTAPAPGSLAALIVAYRGSAEFRDIPAEATRANYLRYLDIIATKDGHRTVAGMRPKHVYAMRDRYAETPGKANNWLTVFRVLMAYACKIDMRGDNPASGVKALKIGEYEPWPADLLRVCLDVATPMTRLLIVTGLCSGQRVSDVIRMQYGWIRDGIMELTQKKTRAQVAIPMHPFWIEELGKLERRSVTLMYDRSGTPFGTTGAIQSRLRDLMATKEVQQVIADLVAREMVPDGTDFVFHGLRKNACCYLLELGMNESEIGLMLGMSPQMVRHYGKRARALMIAREAAEKIGRGEIISMSGGKTDRLGPISAKKAK
ncbi:MAG: tyrosine-type recombinase/integrase [Pseudomonadota bacterium]